MGLSGVDIPLVINTVQGSQRNKRENVQKYTPPDYSSKEKVYIYSVHIYVYIFISVDIIVLDL